jgi:hypoxanthine phosphoribosyltransferase
LLDTLTRNGIEPRDFNLLKQHLTSEHISSLKSSSLIACLGAEQIAHVPVERIHHVAKEVIQTIKDQQKIEALICNGRGGELTGEQLAQASDTVLLKLRDLSSLRSSRRIRVIKSDALIKKLNADQIEHVPVERIHHVAKEVIQTIKDQQKIEALICNGRGGELTGEQLAQASDTALLKLRDLSSLKSPDRIRDIKSDALIKKLNADQIEHVPVERIHHVAKEVIQTILDKQKIEKLIKNHRIQELSAEQLGRIDDVRLAAVVPDQEIHYIPQARVGVIASEGLLNRLKPAQADWIDPRYIHLVRARLLPHITTPERIIRLTLRQLAYISYSQLNRFDGYIEWALWIACVTSAKVAYAVGLISPLDD